MNNKRATSEQSELLVSWVADRPSMASGRCEGLEGRVTSKIEWDELAQTLNAIRFGAQKPGEKWQQTWRDLKGNTKKKASRHRVELGRTGGGIARIPLLTPLDEKILAIIGPETIEGVPLIVETIPGMINEIEIEDLPQLPESDEEGLSAMPGSVLTDLLPATPGPSGVKRKASDKGLFTKRAFSDRFLKEEEEKNVIQREKNQNERERLLHEKWKWEKVEELGAALLASMTALLASMAAQRQEEVKFREALMAELLK